MDDFALLLFWGAYFLTQNFHTFILGNTTYMWEWICNRKCLTPRELPQQKWSVSFHSCGKTISLSIIYAYLFVTHYTKTSSFNKAMVLKGSWIVLYCVACWVITQLFARFCFCDNAISKKKRVLLIASVSNDRRLELNYLIYYLRLFTLWKNISLSLQLSCLKAPVKIFTW